MPSGGAHGGGRKKGSKNRATREREADAARGIREAGLFPISTPSPCAASSSATSSSGSDAEQNSRSTQQNSRMATASEAAAAMEAAASEAFGAARCESQGMEAAAVAGEEQSGSSALLQPETEMEAAAFAGERPRPHMASRCVVAKPLALSRWDTLRGTPTALGLKASSRERAEHVRARCVRSTAVGTCATRSRLPRAEVGAAACAIARGAAP